MPSITGYFNLGTTLKSTAIEEVLSSKYMQIVLISKEIIVDLPESLNYKCVANHYSLDLGSNCFS